MAAIVTVSFELIDETWGAWCRDCALSSGVQFTFALTTGSKTTVTQINRCADCGGDRITSP